jgi:serine/threonine protein kinase
MTDTSAAEGRLVPRIDGITDLVQIGRGGFGTVFRGHQPDINRTVAIKVLNGHEQDAESHRRFAREVTAMVPFRTTPMWCPCTPSERRATGARTS